MTFNLLRLIRKELNHDAPQTAMFLAAVVAAVAVTVSQTTVLDGHDRTTALLLQEKRAELEAEMDAMEEDYRELMLQLGLNMYIMPADQDLQSYYEAGHTTTHMPEEYVDRLAASKIITVRHLLPIVEQKVAWPEHDNRNILLVGTRGEVSFTNDISQKQIIAAVPVDHIVLGYELWNKAGLEIGDSVTLLGKEFTVHKTHPRRGTVDDITVWIDLKQAQDLLNLDGRINGILALQCICIGGDLESLNKSIPEILPNTKVIFFENEVTTRADARARARRVAQSSLQAEEQHRFLMRRELERTTALLIPIAVGAACVFVAVLMVRNVHARKPEIGILRALGLRTSRLLIVFLSRAFIIGTFGGTIGMIVGYLSAVLLTGSDGPAPVNALRMVSLLVATPVLSVVVSWIPVFLGVGEDPARLLQER